MSSSPHSGEQQLPVMSPPSSSSAASSPTKPLFHLPHVPAHHSNNNNNSHPAAGARGSMARSSMATTLGGAVDVPPGQYGDLEGGTGHAGGGGGAGGGKHDKGWIASKREDKYWRRVMSEKNKNHFVAALAEYIGTTLFLFFAFGGTNVANIPSVSVTDTVVNTSQLLYISLSFGFSLTVCAWIFFRVSGGLFNPAVSLGLALVGAITPLRAAILTFVQLLGGMTAAALVSVLTPGGLYVQTTLSGGINTAQGLFLEMFLTSLLMCSILWLAAEKHKATFLAPVGIGLALFVAEMTGVYWTGGSLNPARSFGPAVVARSFPGYHWIYWLGPALGACLAAAFYELLKYLEYEDVVPDQDAGPAHQEPMAEEDSDHHANQIREAEQVTDDRLARHHQVVARSSCVAETPLTSASDVQAAKMAELDAKLDALLAAVTAINTRDREQHQMAEQSRTGTPLDHKAPYSVLT